MGMAINIPIIDFEQASIEPEILAKEVLQACTNWGEFARRGLSELEK